MLSRYVTLLLALPWVMADLRPTSIGIDFCESKPNGELKIEDCSNVYVSCSGGNTTLEFCDNDSVYDDHSKRCVHMTESDQCQWLTAFKQRPDCRDKVKGLYPSTECSAFYVQCVSGGTLYKRCPNGTLFSPEKRTCTSSTHLACQHFVGTPLDRFCEVNNGSGLITNCSPYYLLCGSTVTVEKCPPGEIFETTGGCVRRKYGQCPLEAPYAITGLYMESVLQASRFCYHADYNRVYTPVDQPFASEVILCAQNTGVLLRCSTGQIFDRNSSRCIPNITSEHFKAINVGLERHILKYVCTKDGHGFHRPYEQSAWYVNCLGQLPKLMVCPLNHVYDKSTSACLPKIVPSSTTKQGLCQGIKNGVLLQESLSLGQCLICYEGQLFTKHCKESTLTSIKTSPTRSISHISAIDVKCGISGEKKVAIAQCSPYYVNCRNGSTEIQECPKGLIFKEILEDCYEPSADDQCSHSDLNPCRFKLDGLYALNQCSPFYLNCYNNTFVWEECPTGEKFSESLRTCKPGCDQEDKWKDTEGANDTTGTMDTAYLLRSIADLLKLITKLSLRTYHHPMVALRHWHDINATQNLQFVSDEKDNGFLCSMENRAQELEPCSRKFILCKDGEAYDRTCPDGTVFFILTASCVARSKNPFCGKHKNNPCHPNKNGTISLLPCSNIYLQCTDGSPSKKVCADDKVFFSETSSCIPRWSNRFCPCPTDDHQLRAQELCSGTYTECLNGWAFNRSCPDGRVFFNLTQTCVEKWKNQYCKVQSNNPCYPDKNIAQALEPCSATYIQCIDGSEFRVSCKDDKVFFNESLSCVPRWLNPFCQELCESYPTNRYLSTAEKHKLRALEPCSAVYVACDYAGYTVTAVYKTCPSGTVFFNQTESCVAQEKNPYCKTLSDDQCHSNENEKHALQPCSRTYLQCINGSPFTKTCKGNTVFSDESSSCVPKWQNRFCPEMMNCPTNVYELRALEKCSDTYIICNYGSIQVAMCPYGKVFLESSKNCVDRTDNLNCSETTATTTCITGTFTEDPDDCSVAYRCEDGVEVKFTCPQRMGFNLQLKACDWKDNVPSCKQKRIG